MVFQKSAFFLFVSSDLEQIISISQTLKLTPQSIRFWGGESDKNNKRTKKKNGLKKYEKLLHYFQTVYPV